MLGAHGPDDIADAISRAAPAPPGHRPRSAPAGALASARRRSTSLKGGVRLERTYPMGEDRGARLVDGRDAGSPAAWARSWRQIAASRFREHDPRQRIAGENPAGGQFLDRISVVQVEPGFHLGIGLRARCRRRRAHARRRARRARAARSSNSRTTACVRDGCSGELGALCRGRSSEEGSADCAECKRRAQPLFPRMRRSGIRSSALCFPIIEIEERHSTENLKRNSWGVAFLADAS